MTNSDSQNRTDQHSAAARAAAEVRACWEALAATPYRDFFVASQLGWDDPAARRAQAAADAAMVFTFTTPEQRRDWDVLEIGCGTGRLAECVAGQVRSYTGIDVSPRMLDEARRRCGRLAGARFAESDGVSIPAALRDRAYDFAFAASVYIHCPRSVIEASCASALEVLKPGGELRVDLFADPGDAEGVEMSPEVAEVESRSAEVKDAVGPLVERILIANPWVGHRFRYREAVDMCRSLGAAEPRVWRIGSEHIYAIIRKAPAPGVDRDRGGA